jgi:hypothetical protein
MKPLKPLTQKILLLLITGATLSICYTPRQYWRTVKITGKEWKKINKKELQEEIRKLYQSKMIEKKESANGFVTIVLTDKGKLKALTYHFENMKIERRPWDEKWRVVFFDIPEIIKKGRDALRWKLKELGFFELQKSVFIFPYECKNEVDFIIEYFNLRKYVRFAIVDTIDNELHLKKIFRLN